MNRTLTWKLLVISVVTGVILIALAMVNGTITDRQKYRDDAVKSIEASYAGPQTVIGPVLVRPYTQTTVTMEDGEKGVKKRVEHVAVLTAVVHFETRTHLINALAGSKTRLGGALQESSRCDVHIGRPDDGSSATRQRISLTQGLLVTRCFL